MSCPVDKSLVTIDSSTDIPYTPTDVTVAPSGVPSVIRSVETNADTSNSADIHSSSVSVGSISPTMSNFAFSPQPGLLFDVTPLDVLSTSFLVKSPPPHVPPTVLHTPMCGVLNI